MKGNTDWLNLYVSPNDGVDVLVLAGDIAVGAGDVAKVVRFFKSLGYDKIVYTPGNHEYYGSYMRIVDPALQRAFNEIEGAFLLNDSSVNIDGVTFFGGTLWTNFRNDPIAKAMVPGMINDFHVIKDMTSNAAVRKFEATYQYIKMRYEQVKGPKVVVTHFLPAIECIAPQYQGPNMINTYFASDLGDFVANLQDTTWMFGHTHDSVDLMLGDTRVLCNPMGYFARQMNPGWNKDIVVNV